MLSVCYIAFQRLLQPVGLVFRSPEFKELEVVVPRHELALCAGRSILFRGCKPSCPRPTFCTFLRELSSPRRTLPIVLEELSGMRERSMIMSMPTARLQHRYDHRAGCKSLITPPRCTRESHLSVSNSSSVRHWELDQLPTMGDPTHAQLGTGDRVSVDEVNGVSYTPHLGRPRSARRPHAGRCPHRAVPPLAPFMSRSNFLTSDERSISSAT